MKTSNPTSFGSASDIELLRSLTERGCHPNLLIACQQGEIESTAGHLSSWCASPIWRCGLPGALKLPRRWHGTLLLGPVESLNLAQQIELYDWLTRDAGATQVVSLTAAELELLVANGRFLEGLFYRLNVVRLDAA